MKTLQFKQFIKEGDVTDRNEWGDPYTEEDELNVVPDEYGVEEENEDAFRDELFPEKLPVTNDSAKREAAERIKDHIKSFQDNNGEIEHHEPGATGYPPEKLTKKQKNRKQLTRTDAEDETATAAANLRRGQNAHKSRRRRRTGTENEEGSGSFADFFDMSGSDLSSQIFDQPDDQPAQQDDMEYDFHADENGITITPSNDSARTDVYDVSYPQSQTDNQPVSDEPYMGWPVQAYTLSLKNKLPEKDKVPGHPTGNLVGFFRIDNYDGKGDTEYAAKDYHSDFTINDEEELVRKGWTPPKRTAQEDEEEEDKPNSPSNKDFRDTENDDEQQYFDPSENPEQQEKQQEEPEKTEEPEDPDRQGTIRVVANAHLVYKRKDEDDNTFCELWIYNADDHVKNAVKIRKDILAGTDIESHRFSSKDGSQKYSVDQMGNIAFLKIEGLPN